MRGLMNEEYNMTEEEAKTKWCPHVRITGSNTSDNTYEKLNKEVCCIASDCMMWKWINRTEYQDNENVPNSERGYCGLAK